MPPLLRLALGPASAKGNVPSQTPSAADRI